MIGTFESIYRVESVGHGHKDAVEDGTGVGVLCLLEGPPYSVHWSPNLLVFAEIRNPTSIVRFTDVSRRLPANCTLKAKLVTFIAEASARETYNYTFANMSGLLRSVLCRMSMAFKIVSPEANFVTLRRWIVGGGASAVL